MHLVCQHFPRLVLQCIDFLVSQASFHATVRYAVAVAGALLHTKEIA